MVKLCFLFRRGGGVCHVARRRDNGRNSERKDIVNVD
jgi:hypothetical protein